MHCDAQMAWLVQDDVEMQMCFSDCLCMRLQETPRQKSADDCT